TFMLAGESHIETVLALIYGNLRLGRRHSPPAVIADADPKPAHHLQAGVTDVEQIETGKQRGEGSASQYRFCRWRPLPPVQPCPVIHRRPLTRLAHVRAAAAV